MSKKQLKRSTAKARKTFHQRGPKSRWMGVEPLEARALLAVDIYDAVAPGNNVFANATNLGNTNRFEDNLSIDPEMTATISAGPRRRTASCASICCSAMRRPT